ncbi:MAG: GntR family transcriptional regulator [Nakamurella sp.]
MSQGPFVRPLDQQSTPRIIADKLRQAIGHGELPAGTQLIEAELARQLGVSRGPLREGIQRLTQEGLVNSIRNRGVFVIEMNPANVRDMYLARGAVERAAVAQIQPGGDAAAASAALLSIVDTMALAVERKDDVESSEADMAFHQELVARAGSPRLNRMHQTLLTETRMCITALQETYRVSDDRVDEHRAIAEALATGPVELVDRLLLDHMDDALRRLTGNSALSPDAAAPSPDPPALRGSTSQRL